MNELEKVVAGILVGVLILMLLAIIFSDPFGVKA